MPDNKYENIREKLKAAGIATSPEDIKATAERLALWHFQSFNSEEDRKKANDFLATQTVDSKYFIENVVNVYDPYPNEIMKEFRAEMPNDLKYFMPSLARMDGIRFKNEMTISIQVGQGIASYPSRAIESREDIANFTHFEVMVIDDKFVEPYKEYWDLFLGDSSYGIYKFVPKKLIELSIAKAAASYGLEPIEK